MKLALRNIRTLWVLSRVFLCIQYTSNVGNAATGQARNERPARHTVTVESRRDYSAIVGNNEVARREPVTESLEQRVVDGAGISIQHHETRIIPPLERGLSDEFDRQVVVEIRGLERARHGNSVYNGSQPLAPPKSVGWRPKNAGVSMPR